MDLLPAWAGEPGIPAAWCSTCHRIAVRPDHHHCPNTKGAPS